MRQNAPFLIKDIPKFNPVTQYFERKLWWQDEIRKCMEGIWYDGYWMPGVLYFYVNFWRIEISSSSGNKGKVIGRPWLRDIEWEKAYYYMEARGFSGFADDPEFTCNELLGPNRDEALIELNITNNYIRVEDLNKTYIPAREYLFRQHKCNYGKPLFQNEAYNIIDLEAREGGKSYFASGCIAHNWIFDGSFDYDMYKEQRSKNEPMVSQTLVGAIESQYSNDLLKKFRLGYENLPGKITYKGEEYPSPLAVTYSGSLRPGTALEIKRSGSKLHHRTFQDNPLAANGTRPSLAMVEEVGFCDNIEEVLGALKEAVSASGRQFGTIWMFGTGGLTRGIAANYTKKIFYNPEKYRCLTFKDVYEHKEKNIGLFYPKYRVLNDFKSPPNYIGDEPAALAKLLEDRRKNEDNKMKYASEVINNPIVPSEIFYSAEGSFFPTMEIKRALSNLTTNKKIINSSSCGFCVEDELGKIIWKNTNDQPIREFPFTANENHQGCIEIFEHPFKGDDGSVPSNVYLAGTDPALKDGFEGSLLSTFIINKLTRRIVAEYTAKHETTKEYYENLRKLLIYYNAKCNYESQIRGLAQHFETKNSLHLLSNTPRILKEQNLIVKMSSKGLNNLGTPASESINWWHRNLSKEWLLEPSFDNPDILNLYTIRSISLLEELLLWNPEANFDRVSALGMLMILLTDGSRRVVITEEEKTKSNIRRFDEFMMTNSILKHE